MDNQYTVETNLFGAVIRPFRVTFLEPITKANLHELEPGEWIWDDKLIERPIHEKSLSGETLIEPAGFRQIKILDLDLYPRYSSQPFMLSDVEGNTFDCRGGWTYFSEGRFFRLKKE